MEEADTADWASRSVLVGEIELVDRGRAAVDNRRSPAHSAVAEYYTGTMHIMQGADDAGFSVSPPAMG